MPSQLAAKALSWRCDVMVQPPHWPLTQRSGTWRCTSTAALGPVTNERSKAARRPSSYAIRVRESPQGGASLETLIVDALADVFRMLDGAKGTPRTRELRAEASFYDRAVKHWAVSPPTIAQLDAMFDLVVELHGKTMTTRRSPA